MVGLGVELGVRAAPPGGLVGAFAAGARAAALEGAAALAGAAVLALLAAARGVCFCGARADIFGGV